MTILSPCWRWNGWCIGCPNFATLIRIEYQIHCHRRPSIKRRSLFNVCVEIRRMKSTFGTRKRFKILRRKLGSYAVKAVIKDNWLKSKNAFFERRSGNPHALRFRHSETKPLYVDGPFREWIWDQTLSYFVLLADPNPQKIHDDIDPDEPESAEDWANWTTKFTSEFPESRREIIKAPTIHEQEDGTIMSVVITGSSTKESLVCWIQFLQRLNPKLAKIPVVFRMSHGTGEIVLRKEDMDDVKKKELILATYKRKW